MRLIDPALMTPGIARTFSTSALMNATRRSKSLYRNSGVSKVKSLSRPDSEVGVSQVLKGLQQQAAACQQHNGERRLDHDERVPEPMAARAGRAAPAVAEPFLRRESRPSQRGRKSESQRGGDRNGGGKCQHAPVEREARRAHGLGHQPFQKSHRGKRESESGKRTERGEHQAFGQELRDQPSAARAKRRAHGDFPAARGAARKQEIRQIDARDQQQRHRRAQQQDQRGLCFARDLFAQRHDDHRMRASEILRGHLQAQCRHGLSCVLQRDAGLEPRDDLRVVPGEVPSHPGRKRRRHPDVDVARRHEVEVLRHDADHLVGSSLSEILRPTMSGAPPKRRCHSPWLITTTRTPLLSSSSVKTRPSTGCTPSTLQKFHVTFRAGTCSGSPSPESVASPGWLVARSVNTVLRRRHSIHSAGVGLCLAVTSVLAHVVPDHDETVRVGIGQRTDQHGIEGAEHRRNAADAERQRQRSPRRPDRAGAAAARSAHHVRPRRARRRDGRSERAPSPAPHRPLEASPGGGPLRASRRRDLVGGGHVDERASSSSMSASALLRLKIHRAMDASRCRNIMPPRGHS